MGSFWCGAAGFGSICYMWLKQRLKLRDVLLFLIPIVVFFINNRIKFNVDVPYLSDILRYHFNDFLGGISILGYVNLVLSLKKGRPWRIKRLVSCLVFVLFCGFCWEYVAPLVLENSTGDWLDVLAYLLGGAVYWLLEKWLGRTDNKFQEKII